MGERKARGAPRENSSARPSGALPNAVQDRHLGGENGVRDFFAPDFPALHKTRRKIAWSCRHPAVNDRWREESAGFNLAWVQPQLASMRSAVETNELITSPL